MRRGLLTLLLLPLAACSAGSDDCGGYQCGDGAIVQVAVDDRDGPVALSGDDLEGKPVDVADYRGKPVVVVVWGSWCTPCRAEADDVASVATALGDRAHFVGVDIREQSLDNARQFQRVHALPYPSIYSPDSEVLLDFPGPVNPSSVPAFAILDAQGRVAASIPGELPSKLTLQQLVEDVEHESADAAGVDRG